MIDEKIVLFLKQNSNLTLATCVNNIPYCANCFYAFDEQHDTIIFKSGRDTNHIKQALENNIVAGSVAPDKLIKEKIQGIQFRGIFHEPHDDFLVSAKKVYYKKYPFALVMSGDLWMVEFTYIKMTDNTLGFGKKIEWRKEVDLIES